MSTTNDTSNHLVEWQTLADDAAEQFIAEFKGKEVDLPEGPAVENPEGTNSLDKDFLAAIVRGDHLDDDFLKSAARS